jgi:histone H1/5
MSHLFRFLAEKYKLDMSSASNANNLNSAIKRGSETGALLLPKGLAGRVKLAAKVSLILLEVIDIR